MRRYFAEYPHLALMSRGGERGALPRRAARVKFALSSLPAAVAVFPRQVS